MTVLNLPALEAKDANDVISFCELLGNTKFFKLRQLKQNEVIDVIVYPVGTIISSKLKQLENILFILTPTVGGILGIVNVCKLLHPEQNDIRLVTSDISFGNDK